MWNTVTEYRDSPLKPRVFKGFSIILNHIPNVTEFPEVRAAYLDFVTAWIER